MSFFRKFQDPAETALQTVVSDALKDDSDGQVVEIDRVLRAPTFLTGLASNTNSYTDYVLLRLSKIVDLACPVAAEAAAAETSAAALQTFWETSNRAEDAQTAVAALTTSNHTISDIMLQNRVGGDDAAAAAAAHKKSGEVIYQLCDAVLTFCKQIDEKGVEAARDSCSARHALRVLSVAIRQTILEDAGEEERRRLRRERSSGGGGGGSNNTNNNNARRSPVLDLFGGGNNNSAARSGTPPTVTPHGHLRKPSSGADSGAGAASSSSSSSDFKQPVLCEKKLARIAECAVRAAGCRMPESEALLVDLVQQSDACVDAVCRSFNALCCCSATSAAASASAGHQHHAALVALDLAALLVTECTPQSRGASHVAHFINFALSGVDRRPTAASSSKPMVSRAVDQFVQLAADDSSQTSSQSLAVLGAVCNFVAHPEIFAGTKNVLLTNGTVLPGLSDIPAVRIESPTGAGMGDPHGGGSGGGGGGGSWTGFIRATLELDCDEELASPGSSLHWQRLLEGVCADMGRLVQSADFMGLLRQEKRDLLGRGSVASVLSCMQLAAAYLHVSKLAAAGRKKPGFVDLIGAESNTAAKNIVAPVPAAPGKAAATAESAGIALFASTPAVPAAAAAAVNQQPAAAQQKQISLFDDDEIEKQQDNTNNNSSVCDDASSSIVDTAARLADAAWAQATNFPSCSVLHAQLLVFAVNIARTCCGGENNNASGSSEEQRSIRAAVQVFSGLFPLLEAQFSDAAAAALRSRSAELKSLSDQLLMVLIQTPLMKLLPGRLNNNNNNNYGDSKEAATALSSRILPFFIKNRLPGILQRGKLTKSGAMRNSGSPSSPRTFDISDFATQSKKLLSTLLHYSVGMECEEEMETSCHSDMLTLPTEEDDKNRNGGGGGMNLMLDAFEGAGGNPSVASPIIPAEDHMPKQQPDKPKRPTLALWGDPSNVNDDAPASPAQLHDFGKLAPVRHRPVVRIPRQWSKATSGRNSKTNSSDDLFGGEHSNSSGGGDASDKKKTTLNLFDIDDDDDDDDENDNHGETEEQKKEGEQHQQQESTTTTTTAKADNSVDLFSSGAAGVRPPRLADPADVADMGLSSGNNADGSSAGGGMAACGGGAQNVTSAAAVASAAPPLDESPILLLSESPLSSGSDGGGGKPHFKPSAGVVDLFSSPTTTSPSSAAAGARLSSSASPPPQSESPARIEQNDRRNQEEQQQQQQNPRDSGDQQNQNQQQRQQQHQPSTQKVDLFDDLLLGGGSSDSPAAAAAKKKNSSESPNRPADVFDDIHPSSSKAAALADDDDSDEQKKQEKQRDEDDDENSVLVLPTLEEGSKTKNKSNGRSSSNSSTPIDLFSSSTAAADAGNKRGKSKSPSPEADPDIVLDLGSPGQQTTQLTKDDMVDLFGSPVVKKASPSPPSSTAGGIAALADEDLILPEDDKKKSSSSSSSSNNNKKEIAGGDDDDDDDDLELDFDDDDVDVVVEQKKKQPSPTLDGLTKAEYKDLFGSPAAAKREANFGDDEHPVASDTKGEKKSQQQQSKQTLLLDDSSSDEEEQQPPKPQPTVWQLPSKIEPPEHVEDVYGEFSPASPPIVWQPSQQQTAAVKPAVDLFSQTISSSSTAVEEKLPQQQQQQQQQNLFDTAAAATTTTATAAAPSSSPLSRPSDLFTGQSSSAAAAPEHRVARFDSSVPMVPRAADLNPQQHINLFGANKNDDQIPTDKQQEDLFARHLGAFETNAPSSSSSSSSSQQERGGGGGGGGEEAQQDNRTEEERQRDLFQQRMDLFDTGMVTSVDEKGGNGSKGESSQNEHQHAVSQLRSNPRVDGLFTAKMEGRDYQPPAGSIPVSIPASQDEDDGAVPSTSSASASALSFSAAAAGATGGGSTARSKLFSNPAFAATVNTMSEQELRSRNEEDRAAAHAAAQDAVSAVVAGSEEELRMKVFNRSVQGRPTRAEALLRPRKGDLVSVKLSASHRSKVEEAIRNSSRSSNGGGNGSNSFSSSSSVASNGNRLFDWWVDKTPAIASSPSARVHAESGAELFGGRHVTPGSKDATPNRGRNNNNSPNQDDINNNNNNNDGSALTQSELDEIFGGGEHDKKKIVVSATPLVSPFSVFV